MLVIEQLFKQVPGDVSILPQLLPFSDGCG